MNPDYLALKPKTRFIDYLSMPINVLKELHRQGKLRPNEIELLRYDDFYQEYAFHNYSEIDFILEKGLPHIGYENWRSLVLDLEKTKRFTLSELKEKTNLPSSILVMLVSGPGPRVINPDGTPREVSSAFIEINPNPDVVNIYPYSFAEEHKTFKESLNLDPDEKFFITSSAYILFIDQETNKGYVVAREANKVGTMINYPIIPYYAFKVEDFTDIASKGLYVFN